MTYLGYEGRYNGEGVPSHGIGQTSDARIATCTMEQ